MVKLINVIRLRLAQREQRKLLAVYRETRLLSDLRALAESDRKVQEAWQRIMPL
jgi:hypothetical protein